MSFTQYVKEKLKENAVLLILCMPAVAIIINACLPPHPLSVFLMVLGFGWIMFLCVLVIMLMVKQRFDRWKKEKAREEQL